MGLKLRGAASHVGKVRRFQQRPELGIVLAAACAENYAVPAYHMNPCLDKARRSCCVGTRGSGENWSWN